MDTNSLGTGSVSFTAADARAELLPLDLGVRARVHRRTTFNRIHHAPAGTESVDFDLHESKQYIDHVIGLGKMGRKMKGGIRWVLLILTGAITGFIAIAIDSAVADFFWLRATINTHLMDTQGTNASAVAVQYFVHVGICLLLAAIAGYLVCFVEPLAAGSGIPEVKCFLNGVHLPRVVDFLTLVAKAPGVMFSVAAGMPCGKEGPMIHSGAITGGVISKHGVGPFLSAYRADVEKRDLVASGAAAGVAAAFGAPLGGVMFAMEEGASFFSPVIMLRCFVACISATLTVRFFLGGIEDKSWGLMGSAAPLSFGKFEDSAYHIWEMPVFILMGAFGGLCGAGFNAANTKLTKWRQRNIGGTGRRRYIEVFVVTFVVASVMFFGPIVFGGTVAYRECLKMEEPSGHCLAVFLFRSSGGNSIGSLFHAKVDFETVPLVSFGLIYYVLACWTYGLGLPSGLFVPSLLTGAVFGRFVGQMLYIPMKMDYNDPNSSEPGVYALLGATALLSGMARITISLAVILMEASGTTQYALPIFITTIASKWVGDIFTIGLYDIHIELKHVPLLEGRPDKDMMCLRARDVMTSDLMTFELVETVENLFGILEGCNHHGFPVLHQDGHFCGMVKRDTMLGVLWKGRQHECFQDPDGELQEPPPIVPYTQSKIVRTPAEIKKVLTEADYLKRIDLRPYVNQGCYTVPEFASMTRVYMLFRGMGLRHLPVVNHSGSCCGIITRKDLILATDHSPGHTRSFSHVQNSMSISLQPGARRATLLANLPRPNSFVGDAAELQSQLVKGRNSGSSSNGEDGESDQPMQTRSFTSPN